MIKEFDNYAIYIHSDDKNCIYNKITSTQGQSFYPDILTAHSFLEAELIDDEAYQSALLLQKKYSRQHIFFISANDEALVKYIGESVIFMDAFVPTTYPDYVYAISNSLASNLALSVSMARSMEQMLCFYSINHDLHELEKDIFERFTLPVKTKNEGKKIYEFIRETIIR